MVSKIAGTFYADDLELDVTLQKFFLESFSARQESLLNSAVGPCMSCEYLKLTLV